ncbi:MarR family transcriptional regulator [Paeniglutamicibacter antarcticus]|uniref:MarR family transcriptional regulator n=1 Tax=Arthrobacter terrae TaxID=2935737 RepID=A0A931G408_9MICC|nr:MarR family transcriptional regulator [Arthrobacter terrae]MBG0739256.1 MarR family transcriptional regulator [Arthrobacter terrae]
MFVLTMDQRASRQGRDLVPDFLATLRQVSTVLPFERSVGDEVQGVVMDAGTAVEVAMCALRSGHWYVGVGLGSVDLPLPASSREGSGSAFVAARSAVEAAKKTGERVALAVRWSSPAASPGKLKPGCGLPEPTQLVAAAQAVLVLIGRLVRARTDAEWRVLDLLTPGERGGQAAVAQRLGISPQAVSKAVLRSGWQEEQKGRMAAATLLGLAATAAWPEKPGKSGEGEET